MRCEEAVRLLSPYIDSELDPRTSFDIAQHLETCPACARRFAGEVALEARLADRLRGGGVELQGAIGTGTVQRNPMPELSTVDIQIGRTALQQGLLTRPQLDQGVALVRGGQAPDLGHALVMAGTLTSQQLDYLHGAAGFAPAPAPEAPTLHDPGAYGAPAPSGGYPAGGYGGPGAGYSGGSGYGPPVGYQEPAPYGSSPAGYGGGYPANGPQGSSGGLGVDSSGPMGMPGGSGGVQLGEIPVEGAGQKIGEWIVQREVARGGMGVVYEVNHETRGERAALKVLLPQGGSISEKKLKRFQREIEASKKLDHPAIVKVIDSGTFNGYPFLTMEFVEGKGLDRLLKDDLDLEIGMEVLETVARAVHVAHEQGVVHRDLKPANVLVSEDMKPKLTDFGLAKNKDHTSILTNSGSVLGTPYYLSPEQAQGHSKNIDRRADIYSLGVIMYELATGRLPFVGQTTVELYNRIIHDDPVPPTKFKPQLTKAFETVCLKAMAKNPADRYQTATEFADDVKALLAGGTIRARGEGAVGQAVKNLRKKLTPSAVLVLSGVGLVLAVGGVVGFHVHQEKSRRAELVAAELADRRTAVEDKVKLARDAVERGNVELRAHRLSNAVAAAEEALTALDQLDTELQKTEYQEENRAPLEALAGESDGDRRCARALGLVLKARATMLGDENGAMEQAQRHLTTVLEEVKPPESAVEVQQEVLLAQAELHVLGGKLDNALTEYKNAFKLREDSLRAQEGRIGVHLLLEEFEDVLPLLVQSLKRFADPAQLPELKDDARKAAHAQLLLQRAEVLIERDDLTGATEDLKAAQQLRPTWWRPRTVLARILARQGRSFEARDLLEEAVKAAGDEKALALVASSEVLLLLRGNEAEAYERASQAAAQDPSLLVAQVVKAEAAEAKLDTKVGRLDAEAVDLRAQPRDWRLKARAKRVPARLAAVAGDVKNIKEALDLAKKAHAEDEFSAQGRLLLARLQLDPTFEDQYLDSAERLFKQVGKQRPGSLEAMRGQGLVLLARHPNDPSRAKLRLEEAQKLDPRDPWTLTALAQVFKEAEPSKADQLWERAAIMERDVRRPEGLAYAQGLRQLKIATRLLGGKRRAEHLDKAEEAFRRAVWLDPCHVQALTGLALKAHQSEAHKKADGFLKRALAHNPRATATRILQAHHACSRDLRQTEPRAAQDAVRGALELAPDAIELVPWKTLVKLQEGLSTQQVEGAAALAPRLTEAYAAFDDLRKKDPWNIDLVFLERDLLGELNKSPAMRALPDEATKGVTDRLAQLNETAQKVGEAMDGREKEAEKLIKKVEVALADGETDPAELLEPATKATQLAPWRADGWAALAKVRSDLGDAWAALSAGIRASWLDDVHAAALFPYLRRAGRTSATGDLTPRAERMVALEKAVLPFHADLELMLRQAPMVARALTGEVEISAAKQAKDGLEAVISRAPTQLTAHALLGGLFYGAEREDPAVQQLLFVATACDGAGEAYYLAAVATAAMKNPSAEKDALAIQMLEDATQAGFDWSELGKGEPKLERLRKSPLWSRLVGK